ncbi:MAG: hypothetical protein CENE_00558 [Candidatus Celerinatantimonas neptuna]|nr:MAG: hypothetical protein CENE_00558 [Candidatus Celerinatantimonas neptuna]
MAFIHGMSELFSDVEFKLEFKTIWAAIAILWQADLTPESGLIPIRKGFLIHK